MTSPIDAIALAGLGGHGVATLALTALTFALFIHGRLPIATVCLGVLFVLPLLFLVFPLRTASGPASPYDFFLGFGHQALVAISALMVLGHGLIVTGALEPLARRLAALLGKSPRASMLVVLLGVAMVSGFVNDTPVVVMMIPLLLAALARTEMGPAKMLMPMNFAVLIGGMATTIGTSTNLIVVSMAQDLDAASLRMFDFYPVVALAAIPGLAYLWLVAPLLLRDVPATDEAYTSEVFDASLRVEKEGWSDGKTIDEVVARTEGAIRVRDVVDANGKRLGPRPDRPLREGDVLHVHDTVANLKQHEGALGAKLHGLDDDEDDKAADADAGATAKKEASNADGGDAKRQKRSEAELHDVVAQLVITPESALVGRSVRGVRLATHYDVLAVGLRPARAERRWRRQDIADRSLGAGDILLIQGKPRAVRDVQDEGLGLLLDASYVVPRQQKAGIALASVFAVVLLAATGLVPIAIAALGGVLVLLLSRTLSWRDIGASLSAKVIMLIAASLALGQALTMTGATAFLAAKLVASAGTLSPAMMLVLVMGLMGATTNFVSNNAAAAIGTPLAVDLARALSMPAEPFVLAVLFGCNLCYLTPMGYQTNLLVMNAAGYRFGDFLRVGAPLFAIMWAALSWLLIRRYGL